MVYFMNRGANEESVRATPSQIARALYGARVTKSRTDSVRRAVQSLIRRGELATEPEFLPGTYTVVRRYYIP